MNQYQMSKVLFTRGMLHLDLELSSSRRLESSFEVKEIKNSWPYKNVSCDRQFHGLVL